MDVSIIIINYNTKELTVNCINSVIKQTSGITYEIIVVDNNSSDGSSYYIHNKYPEIHLIRNSENIGFGQANNYAVSFATGKYLFFLNSDTLLLNNAINLFYTFMQDHLSCKIGTIGGNLVDINNFPTESFGDFITFKKAILLPIYRIFKILKHNNEKDWNIKNITEVQYVIGADMFIVKELFLKFKGFDPAYFMYFEESDLQFQLMINGYKNYIIPEPIIMHFEGACFDYVNNVSNKKRMMIEKSMFIYFKNNKRFLPYLIFRFGYAFIRIISLFDTRYSVSERIAYYRLISSIY